MRTTLNLLTRSGVVFVAFKPALSADQYATLLKICQVAETAEELQNTILTWARAERLEVSFKE